MKSSFRRLLALALLAAALPAAAENPQDKTAANLRHDVVVTATRIETPAREIGSSVTVISRAEIERSRRTTVYDLLRDAEGLAVLRNGGPGASASVFVRGANSEHLLVLLDGTPLNDPMNPSRSCDLAHLSLAGVERIEILRGPQSTLFGSDAMAGVINIISRRGSGSPRLLLESAGGSYGTWTGSAALDGGWGRLGYALALTRYATSGFSAASASYPGNSEADGYRNLTLSGRFVFALAPNAEAGLTVRTVSARADLDNFGGPGGDDPNSRQDIRQAFLRAHGRALLLGNRWETEAALSYLAADRRHENPTDAAHPLDSESGRFRSGRLDLDWRNSVFVSDAQTLTFGAEWEKEDGRSEYVFESAWGPSSSPFPRRDASRLGLYLQDQVRVGGTFFAAAGLRWDRHSRTGTALTLRLAPALVVAASGTRIKASVGTAFKAPSLYQLFAPGTAWGPIGNEALRPEKSTGWDAGIEQEWLGGRLTAGLTYFRQDFRDLIDFDYTLGYINIGRARTEGLEASLEARIGEAAELRARYTRLSARDLDAGTGLPRRPAHKAALDAVWRPARGWEIQGGLAYMGKCQDRDYSVASYPLIDLPAYWLLECGTAWDLSPRIQAYVRAENLLDVRYETVFGYGSPGRTFTGGLRLKLGAS